MGEMHPVVTIIVQVGAVAAALTGITIFIERTWGPVRRWLANALTNPLLEKLDEVKEDFEAHTDYVRYHLGPNGKTVPVHVRLTLVEQQLRKLGESHPDDDKET